MSRLRDAAIFDLDGTLVDSYDAHLAAWRTTAREIGHELTLAEFAAQFGRTNPPIIRELHEWAGRGAPDDAAIARWAERKETLFRDSIASRFPVMPGGPPLLRSLRAAGWSLAVGSSAPPANVRLAVEGLRAEDLFDAVVTGDDVRHGKPDPEVFLLAATRLGAAPHRCVVVEDAPAGIEAARRAGMRSIGLASKGRTPADLAEADLVIASLEELDPPALARLLDSRG